MHLVGDGERGSFQPDEEAPPPHLPRLNSDWRGVEGIPLKLLITMVILAISLPILFTWLSAYDASQLRAALQTTVSRLTQYAESAYASPESSRCVSVNVPAGTFVRATYVRIGGAVGDSFLRESIAYQLEGQREFWTTVAFPLNKTGGGPLYLSPGGHGYDVCFLRHLNCQGRACDYVQVEIAG